MIGHLAAAVYLHHRNIAGQQQVLGLAGLPLGEYRRMLHQPELVRSVDRTLIGEVLHGMPNRLIRLQTKLAHAQDSGHHSTMCTRPVARRSLLIASSCNGPVAVIST